MSIAQGLDCLSPVYLPMSRFSDIDIVSKKVVYGNKNQFFRVPCGHCLNCKRRRVRNTSIRLEMESKFHKDISFWTLTYSNEFLPSEYYNFKFDEDGSIIGGDYDIPTLRKRDLQLFIKRVRTFLSRLDKPYKIRYFACGEYGDLHERPHYHIMFFGLKPIHFEDVRRLWFPRCRVDIQPFYPETCSYIAGYVQKKLYGKEAENLQKFPEFCLQSQCLGYDYFIQHFDEIIENHGISYRGFLVGVPRSYIRKYLSTHPDMSLVLKKNIFDIYDEQIAEYYNFIKSCRDSNIDPNEVFKQRYKNAVFKRREALARRRNKLKMRGYDV